MSTNSTLNSLSPTISKTSTKVEDDSPLLGCQKTEAQLRSEEEEARFYKTYGNLGSGTISMGGFRPGLVNKSTKPKSKPQPSDNKAQDTRFSHGSEEIQKGSKGILKSFFKSWEEILVSQLRRAFWRDCAEVGEIWKESVLLGPRIWRKRNLWNRSKSPIFQQEKLSANSILLVSPLTLSQIKHSSSSTFSSSFSAEPYWLNLSSSPELEWPLFSRISSLVVAGPLLLRAIDFSFLSSLVNFCRGFRSKISSPLTLFVQWCLLN